MAAQVEKDPVPVPEQGEKCPHWLYLGQSFGRIACRRTVHGETGHVGRAVCRGYGGPPQVFDDGSKYEPKADRLFEAHWDSV